MGDGSDCSGKTASTATAGNEYCSIYSLDDGTGTKKFERGSTNLNACGANGKIDTQTEIWTCKTDGCNGVDPDFLTELPAAVDCEKFVANDVDCGAFCETKCSTDEYDNCPSGTNADCPAGTNDDCPACPNDDCPACTNDDCQDSNSATKTNRGFGVIMTSVSLSYVIT